MAMKKGNEKEEEEEEIIKIIKEIREKGIITRYPRFIPPHRPHLSIPPNMTLQDKADFYTALLKGPGITIHDDVYRPATAPGQLSLPERDEAARVAFFSVELPEKKKKSVASIRKQKKKKKVASSSKKPKTTA